MPAYEQAYGIVRPGGIISRVGVPQYENAPVGFASLFGKNATLTGAPATVRAYLDTVLPQVLDGAINPGHVFDRELPLDDIAEGYRLMDTRQALKGPHPPLTPSGRSRSVQVALAKMGQSLAAPVGGH